MAKEQKRIIWTNKYDEDDWKDAFKEYCEINDFDEDEISIYDFINEEIDNDFECEQANLDKPCGLIIAIADLGFWNGRRSGYQLIRSESVKGIFNVGMQDYNTFYCDRYNVKADLTHHDGTHHILFREVKEGANIEKLCEKLFNNEEVTSAYIRRYTRSLRPKVAEVYGW